MKKKAFCLLAAVGMACTLAAEFTDSTGRPYREIVIASDAPDSVRLAAEELRTFLVKLGQQELPVVTTPTGALPVVYLGERPEVAALGIDPTRFGSDEFVIKTVPDALVIAGKDYHGKPFFGPINPWLPREVYNPELKKSALMDQGTLCGVYAFLEEFGGVRFYMPLEIGTVVEPMAALKLDSVDLRRAPRFNYRYPWYSFLTNDRDGSLWMHRAGFGGKAPVMIIHSFDWVNKYQESNPEFWALVDGERAFTNQCVADGKGHLCLNNQGLIDQWTKDIIAFFDANPEFEVYPLAPNDGLSRICECPECQADLDPSITGGGEFSYHIWKFVDRIARGVAERHPDKYIGCIAYEKYREPPRNLELSPNVAVMFCHARSILVNDEYRAQVHQQVATWSELVERMYYWVWYLDHWAPTDNLPILYSEVIAEELKRMADNPKFAGEFIESENRANKYPFGYDRMGTPGLQHLNLYLTARMYWNPEADIPAILDEYFRKFYGPAEEPMREFWMSSEARRNDVMAQNRTASPDVIFDTATIEKLNGALKKAAELAPEGSIYAERIALIAGEFSEGASRLTRLLQTGASLALVPDLSGGGEITAMRPMRFMSASAAQVTPVTWVYFGFDRANLYLKVLCYEPKMDQLVMKQSEKDGFWIWDDDCVEIFIGPDESDLTNFFQLIINADGALWDAKIARANNADATWESQAETTVVREEGRWIMDIRIPLQSIGINDPYFTGDIIANVYRNRVAGETPIRSMWSPTSRDGNFEPDTFGRLRLNK